MNQSREPQGQYPLLQIKTPPALLAPIYSIAREFRGMIAYPLAFFGGMFGTVAITAGSLFAMWWFENHAQASDDENGVADEEFEMEFEPGALTKLGVAPQEIPVKAINEETRTPEEAAEETVTEDETPPPIDTEVKDKEEQPIKDKTPPNKNKDAKISDKNRTDNNPYDNDLPNNLDPVGDPFGDPNGWADMAKDGDPWATSVMMALNNMKVPAWAAKLPAGAPYKFKLKICKDGKVDQVLTKGSSGNPDLDTAILGELSRLKIAPPPANILSKMKASCVTLNYTFSWKAGKVK
jgi:outer membrane biosynthesis protein TonB